MMIRMTPQPAPRFPTVDKREVERSRDASWAEGEVLVDLPPRRGESRPHSKCNSKPSGVAERHDSPHGSKARRQGHLGNECAG